MPISPQEFELNKMQRQLALKKIQSDLQVFNESQEIARLVTNIDRVRLSWVEGDETDLIQINTYFRDVLLHILDSEKDKTHNQNLYPVVFNCLLLLANYWPTNNLQAKEIFAANRVVFPTGSHMDKSELNTYLSSSLTQNTFADPFTHTLLNKRAQSYIQNAYSGNYIQWTADPSYTETKRKLIINAMPWDFLTGGLYALKAQMTVVSPVFLAITMCAVAFFVLPPLPLVAAGAASGAIVLGSIFLIGGLVMSLGKAISKAINLNSFEKESIKVADEVHQSHELFRANVRDLETRANSAANPGDPAANNPGASTAVVSQRLQIVPQLVTSIIVNQQVVQSSSVSQTKKQQRQVKTDNVATSALPTTPLIPKSNRLSA